MILDELGSAYIFLSSEVFSIYADISMQHTQNIREGCGDADMICILSWIVGHTYSNGGFS
jgi:hypothetical protein